MDKLIISVIAITIILLLILTSHLWYRYCVSTTGHDVLCVMRMPGSQMIIGILCIIFSTFMAVIPVIFLDDQWFVAFAVFYLFLLLGVYLCIMVRLWRCVIREDSLTFYTPLLPARKIKFYEIDFAHYTDSHTYGQTNQKTLVGYGRGKKLFSIEEEIYGFPLLCTLLLERGKVDYVPAMETPMIEKTLHRVPAMESFSVTAKTGDKVRDIIGSLFLVPCCTYILWDWTEFELFYQIVAVILLLLCVSNSFSTMLRKITVDFRTISVRNALGFTRTYEIRQITEVEELESFIILYIESKKIAKIAKSSKNFQYLFERLMRTETEIYRKF